MKSITCITLFNSLQYPKFENIIYGKIIVNSENLINHKEIHRIFIISSKSLILIIYCYFDPKHMLILIFLIVIILLFKLHICLPYKKLHIF